MKLFRVVTVLSLITLAVACAPTNDLKGTELPTARVSLQEPTQSMVDPTPTVSLPLPESTIESTAAVPLASTLEASTLSGGGLVITRTTTLDLASWGLAAEDLSSPAYSVDAFEEELLFDGQSIPTDQVAQAKQPPTVIRNEGSATVSIVQAWVFTYPTMPSDVRMSYRPMFVLPLPGHYEVMIGDHGIGEQWPMDQIIDTGAFVLRLTGASISTRAFRKDNIDLTRAEVTIQYVPVSQQLAGYEIMALWFTALPNEFPPSDSYGSTTDVVRTLGTPVALGTEPAITERTIDGGFLAMLTTTEVVTLEADQK